MALTRKMLKAMGVEDEKIDQIIEAHTETVEGLKDQLATYKADAEALPTAQAALAEAKKNAEAADKDPWKVKYDAIKEEYTTYKTEQAQKETRSAKETAYRGLLKAVGVSEKRIDAILKVTDVDATELVDGKIKDADKLTESIKTEWADFITSTQTQGAPPATPPTTAASTSKEAEAEAKMRAALGLPPKQ